ncbi:MAG TPA: hypothetical protein VNM92_13740 [Thermoanaerobaculia bacterium]|nr:hypothetical protein [Thermoanaerobaculia bacterium]
MGTYVRPSAPAPPGRLQSLAETLVEDAADWLEGKSWTIRLPLLLYLAYAFVQHLRDPLYGSFLFGWITVLIHELGHVVLGFGPEFVAVAGGTLFQLGAPIASAFLFLQQRDYFAITVAGCWLSFSIFQMATYIADAREFALDYVTVGSGEGEGIHDWDYMLTGVGLLEQEKTLAFLARTVAFAAGAGSLAAASWLLWRMWRSGRSERTMHSGRQSSKPRG